MIPTVIMLTITAKLDHTINVPRLPSLV